MPITEYLYRIKNLAIGTSKVPPQFYPLYLFIFLISLNACNKQSKLKADHPVQIQKISDSSSVLISKYGFKAAINKFNKDYSLIKDPGLGDQIAYYTFKLDAYDEYIHWDFSNRNLPFYLKQLDSALWVIEKNKAEKIYLYDYIENTFSKGDILYAMAKYDSAYRYYFKGKVLSDELNDKCARASFTSRFAFVNFREGKFRQAASLFMLEFKQRKSCPPDFDNFDLSQAALNNAGACYDALGMVDSARYCFNSTIAYVDTNASKLPASKRLILDIHGFTYGLLGSTYYNRGDNNKAEQLFKESIQLDSYGGNEQKNAQWVRLKLARLYFTTGRLKQVDSLIKDVKLSLDTLPGEAAEMEWNKINADYFNFLNQPLKARPYLTAYLKLKDKNDLIKRSIVENDVDDYFRMVQKRYDLAILKKERQLSALQLVSAIGFSVFMLFIMFVAWRNSKISKKHNLELTQLNQQSGELNLSLQSTLNSLEESHAENTTIMKIVAHDLRNPIGAISNLSGVILKEGASEDQTEIVKMIQISADDSLRLVNDLLNREAVNELKTESVNLSSLIKYCVTQLQFKADLKQQQIFLNTSPVIINVNREKTWRVISNLITNAIKFSANGAIINVTLKADAKTVTIAVKDNGIGIPVELENKIFDTVSKAKRSGTDGEKSYGFGLAISKQIVEAHGGKLWFENNSDRGVTFYVELPLL